MHKTVDEALKSFSGEWVDSHRKFLSGMDHLMGIRDVEVNRTRKEEVWRDDKVRVFHYAASAPCTCRVPVLICYALVNRYYMMDLQENRSLIQNLLAGGLDLYIIDWGYPGKMDAHLTLEDYLDGYLDAAVDMVRERSGSDRINLLGVCQGGTFSLIYTATHPEKIRNLITMVTPVDFHTDEGLLNIWAQDMDIDHLVDTYGVVPGWFMNLGFLMLKPFQLMVDKYVSLLDIMDDRDALEGFVRMEKWIFDSPAQAGEAFRRFLKELYQENRLIDGTLTLDGRPVDLGHIRCPLLNIFGTKDHLVPPSSSRPLATLVGSDDVETFELPIGHIGMYVSGKSQKEIAPRILSWLQARDSGQGTPAPGQATRKSPAHEPSPKEARAVKAAKTPEAPGKPAAGAPPPARATRGSKTKPVSKSVKPSAKGGARPGTRAGQDRKAGAKPAPQIPQAESFGKTAPSTRASSKTKPK